LFHQLYFCFSDGVFQPRHDKTNKRKRLSPSNRLSPRDSNPRLRSNSNINSSRRKLRNSSNNISSSKLRGSNINSSRSRLRGSSNNISNSKLRDNNSINSSSNKLRDNHSVSSRTTQRSTSSKPVGNRISNANSGNSKTTQQDKISSKLRGSTTSSNSNNNSVNSKTTQQNKISSKRRGNTISSSNNSVSSKTTQRINSSKPEGSRINIVNSRTTGPHNNGARLRYISNRSPGKVIVPRAGSLSIAPGSNVVAITVTAFQMTGSVATMASLTSFASTASRYCTLVGSAVSSTVGIGSV